MTLPNTFNLFPHDGNGHPVAVLYDIIPDTRTPGLTDTYYPATVTASGAISVSTQGSSNTRILNGSQRTSASWGSAVALTPSSTPCTYVSIQADVRNEGNVFVGGSNVNASTFSGRELWPGDVITFHINDLANVYIDGLSQQRVLYLATA